MEEKSRNKGLIVLIVILVIIVIGLGSYITYDKFLKKDEEVKENNNKEETSKDDNKNNEELKQEENKVENEPKELVFDKKEVNKWLENFAIELMYVFNTMKENEFNIDFTKLQANKNLLETNNDKFCYAWTKAIFDKSLQYSEMTVDGYEVTGARTYKYSDVNNVYKKLFGEDLSKTNYTCSNELFTIKNDLIYGSFWSGWTGEQEVAKINKIVKNNDIYTLTIDMLYDYSEENGWDKLLKYKPSTVTSYDESIVVGRFEMTFQKVEGNYIIKSLKKTS